MLRQLINASALITLVTLPWRKRGLDILHQRNELAILLWWKGLAILLWGIGLAILQWGMRVGYIALWESGLAILHRTR